MSKIAREIDLLKDSERRIPKENILLVSGISGKGLPGGNRFDRSVVFYEQHSSSNIAQFVCPRGKNGDAYEFYCEPELGSFMKYYSEAKTRDISKMAYRERLSGALSHEKLEEEIARKYIPLRTLFGGFQKDTMGLKSRWMYDEHLTDHAKHDGDQYRFKNVLFAESANMGDEYVEAVAALFMPQVEDLSLKDIVCLQAVCNRADDMQFTHDLNQTPEYGCDPVDGSDPAM